MPAVELYVADLTAEVYEAAYDLLNAEERKRAAAFHFERDRKCWVASRGVLRKLMGKALGIEARNVEFGLEAGGRPFLKSPTNKVDFNLSHSGGMALIGICREGRIGVDIERWERGEEIAEMQEMFCSDGEMRREPGPEELIRIWCAKEACLKAKGTGLDETLRTLTVRAEMGHWRIHFPGGLEATGYCAAVALPPGVACPAIERL